MDWDQRNCENVDGLKRLASICCKDKEMWVQLKEEHPELHLMDPTAEQKAINDRHFMDEFFIHLRKVTNDYYSNKRKG